MNNRLTLGRRRIQTAASRQAPAPVIVRRLALSNGNVAHPIPVYGKSALFSRCPVTRRQRNWLIFTIAFAGVAIYGLFISVPAGPRDVRVFDPDRIATLEVSMWKAYYDKRNVALFSDLVTLSRETYRCSRARAVRIAYHLARAAAAFADLRSDYEQVLPDLEKGYGLARDWTGAAYDPKAIARAELAWWVARRIPGQDRPEQVGALIAELNAQFYSVPRDRVLEASILRARAGRLRDEGGVNANWTEVSRLLTESYRSLHAGVNR
jgi:hypothetical protein